MVAECGARARLRREASGAGHRASGTHAKPRSVPYARRFRQFSAVALAAATILASAPGSARADVLSSLTAPFERALASGSFGLALVLVFLAGLATSLTPCVYR